MLLNLTSLSQQREGNTFLQHKIIGETKRTLTNFKTVYLVRASKSFI